MNEKALTPVFDGHNDTLLNLYLAAAPDKVKLFREGSPSDWHIDLPRAKKGGFVGGMFAIFAPGQDDNFDVSEENAKPPLFNEPLSPPIPMEHARTATFAMVSILFQLERSGALAVCRTVDDIRVAMAQETIAAVLHLEGGEAIDSDLHMLEVLHGAGMRSIGPVWSRTNVFGHGVPFHHPSSPDTGPGLTDVGKELIRACNDLKIMIDLSHINENGFRDVAALSSAPLVATHSNVHKICPHARNLTDWQLGAIRETRGIVGLTFPIDFLDPAGPAATDASLEMVVRHMDALIETLGEDSVGLGSDFDGAPVPTEIGDASGLPIVLDAFRRHGYDQPLIEKIAAKNWMSVLERTIG